MAERTVQKLQTEIDRMEVSIYSQFYFLKCFLFIEWMFLLFSNLYNDFLCRLPCWQRRTRRRGWRRTWSILYRASETSKSRFSPQKHLVQSIGDDMKVFLGVLYALLQKGIWDIWKKALGPGSWVSPMLLGISWCVWVQQNFCERSNEALSWKT